MKKPPFAPFIDSLLRSSVPPWHGVRSRIIARWLGVSLQVLANWRVRDIGPSSIKAPKGSGNRMLYRPDEVAIWLTDGQIQAWELAEEWLERRGLAPASSCPDAISDVVAWLEGLEIFHQPAGLSR